tara:strand:- start:91 stop:207 length:117 start_codon:yes stop_codon:yes gene_type:complete
VVYKLLKRYAILYDLISKIIETIKEHNGNFTAGDRYKL